MLSAKPKSRRTWTTNWVRPEDRHVEADIVCRGLRFSYGYRTVLRGLDLTVPRGECQVILGGNGTGKTTLLRILATLLRPAAGQVLVAGEDVTVSPSLVRRNIGVMAHQTFLYPDLTAEENLRFFARLYDVPTPKARIGEVLALVGLLPRAGDPARTLSRGMQQRLALARALLHCPRVLLLDEPDTGLDAGAQQILECVVGRGLSDGMTIVLTTHRIDRGFRLGNRFAVLSRGRLAYEVTKDDIGIEDLEQRYRACSGATPL